jgi:hypothetical protein
MPADVAGAGGTFLASDRGDDRQLAAALGDGADLLVDCICFTAADATRLMPLARRANKVAAENVLLGSGKPVTVLRPSKVHGVGVWRQREWFLGRRALDRRRALVLARRGSGIEHTTAAANIAAFVEVVAAEPGPPDPQQRGPGCAGRARDLDDDRTATRPYVGGGPPRARRVER